jgi:hypothetical protein
MLKNYRSALFVLVAVILLIAGCSDRGTNVPLAPSESSWPIWPDFNHVFVPPTLYATQNLYPSQLILQIRNPSSLLQMSAYIPAFGTVPMPAEYENKKLPLLILLAPQDADQFFYINHGLVELANEMISNGTIRPMAIVTIGNNRDFGGYFYGNSTPAGHMDDIMGALLVDTFLTHQLILSPGLIDDSTQRGIGGIGMGAYGAFRALLKHPGIYSSISVNDGPLDFDGADGNSGLISLIPTVFQEQGLTSTTYRNFDTAKVWPISRMFVGGAFAFSPQDTLVRVKLDLVNANPPYRNYTMLNRYSVTSDSATLFSNFVKGSDSLLSTGTNVRWGLNLPFDSTGSVSAPTWGRWMVNNLDTLLSKSPTALNDVKIWIAHSSEAEYSYAEQTASWIATLEDKDADVTVRNYHGNSAVPATGNQYVYDLLREMLIFHSNAFGK